MTRPQKAAVAERLRTLGLLHREIADMLGISRSYVEGLLNDPDGEKAKARKRSYRGTCLDCGAPTSGCNGRAAAPERCVACTNARRAAAHGTRSKYQAGCRCADCTQASTVAHREYMARRRAAA